MTQKGRNTGNASCSSRGVDRPSRDDVAVFTPVPSSLDAFAPSAPACGATGLQYPHPDPSPVGFRIQGLGLGFRVYLEFRV